MLNYEMTTVMIIDTVFILIAALTPISAHPSYFGS